LNVPAGAGRIQGDFCRQKHSHKNADPKMGPGGRKPGRKPKDDVQKYRKPTEPQGSCPNLRGFLYQNPYRTFQVWTPQKNLAGYVPGRTPRSANLELHWGVVKGADSKSVEQLGLRRELSLIPVPISGSRTKQILTNSLCPHALRSRAQAGARIDPWTNG
jgi:hypothetical protein